MLQYIDSSFRDTYKKKRIAVFKIFTISFRNMVFALLSAFTTTLSVYLFVADYLFCKFLSRTLLAGAPHVQTTNREKKNKLRYRMFFYGILVVWPNVFLAQLLL